MDNLSDIALQASLRQIAQFDPESLTAAKLQAIECDLAKILIAAAILSIN